MEKKYEVAVTKNLRMSQKNTISGVQFCYHRTPQQGLSRENKLRLSAEMEKLKKIVGGAGRVKIT